MTFIREPPPLQMSTEELLQKARSLKPITKFIPPPPAVVGDVGDFEARINEAKRSPLDRLYDEHMAAKRQRQPQVLVRHGIGQVLGVR